MRRFFGVILILLLVFTGCNRARAEDVPDLMREWLEQRYGREFQVGQAEYRHTPGNVFGNSWYEAEATDLTNGMKFSAKCNPDGTGIWDNYAQVMYEDAVQVLVDQVVKSSPSLGFRDVNIFWNRTPAYWHPDMSLEEFLPKANLQIRGDAYILDAEKAPEALTKIYEDLYWQENDLSFYLKLDGHTLSWHVDDSESENQVRSRVEKFMKYAAQEREITDLVEGFCEAHPQPRFARIWVVCREEGVTISVDFVMEQENPAVLRDRVLELCHLLGNRVDHIKFENCPPSGGKRYNSLFDLEEQTPETVLEELELLRVKK